MQRSKPEALRPDQSRSEGTPSPSEWAERRSKPFGLPFRRLEKVTRRKGETLSSRYQKNGYVHKKTKNLVGPKAAKTKAPKKAPKA